jgi:hypothetical protein
MSLDVRKTFKKPQHPVTEMPEELSIEFQKPDDRLSSLNKAIEDGTILDSTDEELNGWLLALCLKTLPDSPTPGYFSPGDIIKGITVNQIQTDRRNNRTNKLIIFLAIISVGLAVVQIFIALNSLCKS